MNIRVGDQLQAENERLRERVAQLESELEEINIQFRSLEELYQDAPVGLCFVDRNNRFVRINERLAAINARPAKDHIGATIREVLPDLADMIEEFHEQVFTTGEPVLDLEFYTTTPANPEEERGYLVSYLPMKNDAGEVTGVSTVVQDVNELKAAQLAAQQVKDDFIQLVESISDYTWSAEMDSDGNIKYRYYSPVVEQITGRPPEFYMEGPHKWISTVHHEDLPRLRSVLPKILSNEIERAEEEYRILLPDGSERWVRDSMTTRPLPNGKYILDGVVSDITYRKQSQEKFLKAVIDSIIDGVVVADQNGKLVLFNPSAEKTHGLGASEMPSEQWSEKYGLYELDGKTPYPPAELPLSRAILGEIVSDVELIIKNKATAEDTLFSLNAAPLRDAKGKLIGGVVVQRDITKQRLYETKLAAEEKLLRKLLELQEDERKIVSHDIHDGLLQEVIAASMLAESALLDIEKNSPDVSKKITKLADYLSRAIKEGRRLITEVRPMVVDDEGVINAIDYLIAEQESRAGIVIDFHHDVQFKRLETRLEGSIFRIVQEALNNVRRHAQVEQASVKLIQQEIYLTIEIIDDGIGFNLDKVSDERFGLRGIRERARLFGGSAEITSKKGKGTKVFVKLPLIYEVAELQQ